MTVFYSYQLEGSLSLGARSLSIFQSSVKILLSSWLLPWAWSLFFLPAHPSSSCYVLICSFWAFVKKAHGPLQALRESDLHSCTNRSGTRTCTQDGAEQIPWHWRQKFKALCSFLNLSITFLSAGRRKTEKGRGEEGKDWSSFLHCLRRNKKYQKEFWRCLNSVHMRKTIHQTS